MQRHLKSIPLGTNEEAQIGVVSSVGDTSKKNLSAIVARHVGRELKRDVSWHNYFLARMKLDIETGHMPLEPMDKPCHDCAVVCGLYTEISDALKNEPACIQEFISKRWFCHNHRNRACKGNIDNLRRRL